MATTETISVLKEFCDEMNDIKHKLPTVISETDETTQFDTLVSLINHEKHQLATSFKDPMELKLINNEISEEGVHIVKSVSNQSEFRNMFNITVVESDKVNDDVILFYDKNTGKRHINKESTKYRQFQESLKKRVEISSSRDNSYDAVRKIKLGVSSVMALAGFIAYKFKDDEDGLFGVPAYKHAVASKVSSGRTGYESSDTIASVNSNLINIKDRTSLGDMTGTVSSMLGNCEQTGVYSLFYGSEPIWSLIREKNDDYLNPDLAMMKKIGKQKFVDTMAAGIETAIINTALIWMINYTGLVASAAAGIGIAAGIGGLLGMYVLYKLAKALLGWLGGGNGPLSKGLRDLGNMAIIQRFRSLLKWFLGWFVNKENTSSVLLSDIYVDDFWSIVTEDPKVLNILKNTIVSEDDDKDDKIKELNTLIESMRDNYLISKLQTPEDIVRNPENKNILSSSYETNIVYGYEKDLVREYKTQFLENIFQSVKIKKHLNERSIMANIKETLKDRYINYKVGYTTPYPIVTNKTIDMESFPDYKKVHEIDQFDFTESFLEYVEKHFSGIKTKKDYIDIVAAAKKTRGREHNLIEDTIIRHEIRQMFGIEPDENNKYKKSYTINGVDRDIILDYIINLKHEIAEKEFEVFFKGVTTIHELSSACEKNLFLNNEENNELENSRHYKGLIGGLLSLHIEEYIEVDVLNMINANSLNKPIDNVDNVTSEDIDNTSSILLNKIFKTNKKTLEAILIPSTLEYPIKRYYDKDITSKAFHAQSTITTFLRNKINKLAIRSAIYNTSYLLKLAFLEMMTKFQITPSRSIFAENKSENKGFGLAYKTDLESHQGSEILGYNDIKNVKDPNAEPVPFKDFSKQISYIEFDNLKSFLHDYETFMFKTALYEPLKFNRIAEGSDGDFLKRIDAKFVNESNAEYAYKNNSIYPYKVLIPHSIYAGDQLNKVDNETEVNLDMVLSRQFKSLIAKTLSILKKSKENQTKNNEVEYHEDELNIINQDDSKYDSYKNYPYKTKDNTFKSFSHIDENGDKYIIKNDDSKIITFENWKSDEDLQNNIRIANEEILTNLDIDDIDKLTNTCLSSGSRYLIIKEDKSKKIYVEYLDYVPSDSSNIRCILNMEGLTKIYLIQKKLENKKSSLHKLSFYEKGIFDGIYNSSNFKSEISLYVNGLYHKRLYNIHSNNLLDILYNKNNCFHEATINLNGKEKGQHPRPIRHVKIFNVNQFNTLHNWVGTNFPEIANTYKEKILSDREAGISICKDQTYLCKKDKWTEAESHPELKWDKDYIDGLLSIIIGSYGNFRGALKTTSQHGAVLYYLHHLPYNNGMHYLFPDEKGLLYDSYSFSLYITKLSNELNESAIDKDLDRMDNLLSIQMFKSIKKTKRVYKLTISNDFKFNYLLSFTDLIYNNNGIPNEERLADTTSSGYTANTRTLSLNNIGFMLSCHDINSLAFYSDNEDVINNKDFNIDGIYGNGVALVAKNMLPSLNRALPMIPLGLQLMDQKYWYYYDPLRNKNILQCEGTVEEIEDSLANLTSNTIEKRMTFDDIMSFTKKIIEMDKVERAVQKISITSGEDKKGDVAKEYTNLDEDIKSKIISHLYYLSIIVKLRNLSKLPKEVRGNIKLNLDSETWKFTTLEKYKTHSPSNNAGDNRFKFEINKNFSNQLLYLKLETFSRLIKIYINNKHNNFWGSKTSWDKLGKDELIDLIKSEDIQMIRNYPLLNDENIINNLLYSTTVNINENRSDNDNVLLADILVKPQRNMAAGLTTTLSGLVNKVSANAAAFQASDGVSSIDRNTASNFYSTITQELMMSEVVKLKFDGGEIKPEIAFNLDGKEDKIIGAYEHIFGKIDENFRSKWREIQSRFFENIIQKTSNISVRNYITGATITDDEYNTYDPQNKTAEFHKTLAGVKWPKTFTFDGIYVPKYKSSDNRDNYLDYIHNILRSNFQIRFEPEKNTLKIHVDNKEHKQVLETLFTMSKSGDERKSKKGSSSIGRRIELVYEYEDGEGASYTDRGKITDFDRDRTNKYFVKFDNGEEDWVNLDDHKHKFLKHVSKQQKIEILTECMEYMKNSFFCHTGCTHTNANAAEMFYNTLILGKFLSTNVTLDPIANSYYDIDDYEDITSLPQQGDSFVFYNRYNEFIQKNYCRHFGNDEKPGLFCTGHSMGGGYSSTFGYMTIFQAVKYREDKELIKELSQISANTKVHSFAPPRAFNLTTPLITEFIYMDLFDLIRDDSVQGNIVVNISNKGDPIHKVPFIFSHIGSVVLHNETLVNMPGKLLWDTEKALYSKQELYNGEITRYIDDLSNYLGANMLTENADNELKQSIADTRILKLTKNCVEVSNNNFMTFVFENRKTPGNSMGFNNEREGEMQIVKNHFNYLYIKYIEQKLMNIGFIKNNITRGKTYSITEIDFDFGRNFHRPIEYIIENIVELIGLLTIANSDDGWVLEFTQELRYEVLHRRFVKQFKTNRENYSYKDERTTYQINYNYESMDDLVKKLKNIAVTRSSFLELINLISAKNLNLESDFWGGYISEYMLYSNENVDTNPGLLSSALWSRFAEDKFKDAPMNVAGNYLEMITSDVDVATENVGISSSNIKNYELFDENHFDPTDDLYDNSPEGNYDGPNLYFNDTSAKTDGFISNRLIYDFKNWLTSNYSLETLFCNRTIVRNIVCRPKKILFNDPETKLKFSEVFCLETNKYYGYDQSWAGPTQHSTQKYLMYAYMANKYNGILNTCQQVIQQLSQSVKCNEGSVESVSKIEKKVTIMSYNGKSFTRTNNWQTLENEQELSISDIMIQIKKFLDMNRLELGKYLIDNGSNYFSDPGKIPSTYDDKKTNVYTPVARFNQTHFEIGIRGPAYWRRSITFAGWSRFDDDDIITIKIKIDNTDYQDNPVIKAAFQYIANGLNYYHTFDKNGDDNIKSIIKEQLYELLTLFILDNDKVCAVQTVTEQNVKTRVLKLAEIIDNSEADFATLLIGDGTTDN